MRYVLHSVVLCVSYSQVWVPEHTQTGPGCSAEAGEEGGHLLPDHTLDREETLFTSGRELLVVVATHALHELALPWLYCVYICM